MSRKEQYKKYKFGDKQPWLTPIKLFIAIVIILIPIGIYFKIHSSYETSCWKDRDNTIKSFGSDINNYNSLFSKISNTKWIKNKSEFIDQFSLVVDRINSYYEKIQNFTESEYKSNCAEINKELAFSNKFSKYSENLTVKIDEIENQKDVTQKELKCYDEESCNIILEDKLKTFNWNPNLKKDAQGKDSECQQNLDKLKSTTTNFDNTIKRLTDKIKAAKWIQNKNEYNETFQLIRQKIDFNEKRFSILEQNNSASLCESLNDTVNLEEKLYNDILKIDTYLDSLRSNIDRIKRESLCKNEVACDQILNEKFNNAVKEILIEWSKNLNIEQTIDNKNNCYVNRNKIIENAKSNLDTYTKYNQAIIDTDWIKDKEKHLSQLRDLSSELNNDYETMIKQDKSEFNEECSKYSDMISVGDDLSKYLNQQIKIISEINKDYSENLTRNICKSKNDCDILSEKRFEAEIKPKSIIFGSKYNDIESILTAVYPNCYKQKDEMVKFVEQIITTRKTVLDKFKTNIWIGNINEIEQSFKQENEKNEKYKQFLITSTQDEVNKNCGGWPTIYNNYKKDLKLLDFISSNIDLINTSKDDLIRKSNCTDTEVCNSVLKRKLGVAILPLASESQNKPLMNKFK